MTAETTAKGRLLEDSVALVERKILKVSANASSFDVQPRKRIKVKGVNHEIDLWVTVRTAPGYELLVIFECKNTKNKS